jgi:hypothetical protein
MHGHGMLDRINLVYQPLVDILPGQNKIIIDISSQLPGEIANTLDQYTMQFDTAILTNADIWRYGDYRDQIFNHPNLMDKKVFIQSCGYTNTKFSDRCWEISYPKFLFQMGRSTAEFVPKTQNLDYGFSCLNNIASLHRLILGYNFYINNLLDGMLFSQNTPNLEYQSPVIRAGFDFDRWNEFETLLPIACPGETVVEKKFKSFSSNPIIATHPAYANAYCNIVTETECEEYPYINNTNLPIITEKSYKPLVAGQVPIMLAARGHISYLKSLGFEMMEDLYLPGYDHMPVLQKIQNIVSIVKQGREFIQDFYFCHLKEIQHNYELINSGIVDSLILKNIIDTL